MQGHADMVLWIESQKTPTIALVVFGGCYALAALIFLATAFLRRHWAAADLKATTPTMLTPLSVIFGLLIAFLAARVWANLDHANSYVAAEANAIRATVVLADMLPAETRTAVRGALKKHLQFVEEEDWPAMAAGRASLRSLPSGLMDALRVVLSYVPSTPGQNIAQRSAAAAIEQALEQRRSRIVLSHATISSLQWLVIAVLAVLIFLTIAMVHMDRQVTVATNLFMFSTAIAACLVLLMVNDRPFAAGGNTIEPSVLREIDID
ncbi:MAG: DUF4239 domain-containing protein [Methylobacteriaceae bacterium]|nr:DUF4239 domain-containing protein [Methylobacteriaceae bacterium]MBV9245642.1 DUF4239 domain-containing protein [Methylobacteriaceae bacterium]MBV9704669.1 DUF4239 domain-containing protein [Methylobacteriaceae bacterium]